jgi:oxysterol-binding protein 1
LNIISFMNCISAETVALLLTHRAISPNGVHPPGSGTTPLHLAASIGRADIVNLLLDQEGIDDSLRDKDGRTCKEVAKGKAVVKIIEGMAPILRLFLLSRLYLG